MGSIVPRKRQDGTTGYTAQIRIKRAGQAHTESQTFDRRQAAVAWLKKRETELAAPEALAKAKLPRVTLGEAIDRYVAEMERQIGRTKAQVLRSIKTYDIASIQCADITSEEIVAFAREIGAKPQTVSNYLSHLGAVFAIAKPAWGYPLDRGALREATAVTKHLGVTSKAKSRARRPTLVELDQLMEHFADRRRRRPSSNPMCAVIAFAIFSTRRQDEITRITWADLDERHSRILVRDMKNPGEKVGNHVWCDLPPEALRIIKAMPETGAKIFPYGTDAISAAFTRATRFLGIDDLRFHDLRHEGVSRLFEIGWTIPRAAGVSGHRSWQSLQRYAHLRQVGDKFEGWRWVEAIAGASK